MEMFGKTLCVTRNELVLGGIVSPATYTYMENETVTEPVRNRNCMN